MKTARNRSGTTLVEVMIASAILLLLTIAMFDSLAVAARITKVNSEHLAADAYAFDAAWRIFNCSYDDLWKAAIKQEANSSKPSTTDLSPQEAPILYYPGSPAQRVVYLNASASRCDIAVDVCWGPAGKRKKLSDLNEGRLYRLTRSSISRSLD